MTDSMRRERPAYLLEPREDLNLKSLTDEEKADYLAQREILHRAVQQGTEEVRLRQKKLIAQGLMDENGNLLDPLNLDDFSEA
jgi:hypothetical protein